MVDALACFRLTRLVTADLIMARARFWLAGAPGDGTIKRKRTWYFVTCPWCTSIWIGAALVALTWAWPRGWCFPAAALAFSAVAGYLAERT